MSTIIMNGMKAAQLLLRGYFGRAGVLIHGDVDLTVTKTQATVTASLVKPSITATLEV